MSVKLPRHPAFDPLAFGEFGVDSLQRLITERAQPLPVFAQRLEHLRVHPGFGADEKEAALVLHATQVVSIAIAAIGQQHTVSQRWWRRQKRLFTGRVGAQDHGGGGIAQQVHGGVECDGGRLDRLETPRQHLAQAVVNGKGTSILNEEMAQLAKRTPFGAPEHFQRHVTDEPFRHRPSEIGNVGLGHLVIEGFVGDGGPKKGMEATVEIGDRLHTLAGTSRRQRQAQTKGGDDALASTKLHGFATAVEQGFGKDPWELVSD